MHLVKGRKFGLGFCAISLVLACGSKERNFDGDRDRDGGEKSSSEGDETTSEARSETDGDPVSSDRSSGGAGSSTNELSISPPTSAEPTSAESTSSEPTNGAPSNSGSTSPTETPDGGATSTSDAASDGGATSDVDAGSPDAGDGAVPDACGNLDPDCECVDGVLQGRDSDLDTHLSKACEAAPGDDCDDLDATFAFNVCGGCSRDLVGAPGDLCLDCGVLSCSGTDALVCVAPYPAPRRCSLYGQVEVCVDGLWASLGSCSLNQYCSSGYCYSYSIPSTAYAPQAAPDRCNTPDSQCVYGSFHPRDASFEVAPVPPTKVRPTSTINGIPTHAILNSVVGLDLG